MLLCLIRRAVFDASAVPCSTLAHLVVVVIVVWRRLNRRLG